tara:strand:- start:116 stop:325 length:210 start_codon:yes stop_codon:yes gene_type:complete
MIIRRIGSRKDMANGSFSYGYKFSPLENAGVTLQIAALNIGEKDIEITLKPSEIERINEALKEYLEQPA